MLYTNQNQHIKKMDIDFIRNNTKQHFTDKNEKIENIDIEQSINSVTDNYFPGSLINDVIITTKNQYGNVKKYVSRSYETL